MSSDDESMDASDSSMSSSAASHSSRAPAGTTAHAPREDDSDSDSDSDVSMATDTDESEKDGEGKGESPVLQAHVEQSQASASKGKVRRPPATNFQDWMTAISTSLPSIRISPRIVQTADRFELASFGRAGRSPDGKLFEDRSLLPPEIWHQIFTFTVPKALGRLLAVNKLFNSYLDPSSSFSPAIKPDGIPRSLVSVLQPDQIWQASRKRFLPQFPIPLQDFSELSMWRLALGRSCHFCDKQGSPYFQPPADEWRPGPGRDCVSTIWGFGVRACGACLKRRTVKEVDLLMSPSMPTELMTALPFILLTSDLHVLAAASVQTTQPPAEIQYAKCFFKPHIDTLRMEYFRVKSLGAATLDEWVKGLEARGNEKRKDGQRWERWHSSGGLQKVDTAGLVVVPAAARRSTPPSSLRPQTSIIDTKITSGLGTTSMSPISAATGKSAQSFDSQIHSGFPSYAHSQQSQKHERSKEEAIRRKAARRAEIERRCALLEPPLLPDVLVHSESFQAAIQIGTPFTDVDWDLLRPKLLSQRIEAEAVAKKMGPIDFKSRLVKGTNHDVGENFDDAQELADAQWEEIQVPIREEISRYANQVINSEEWQGGANVTRENGHKFAIDILLHVRSQFYAHHSASANRLSNHTDNRASHVLVLENMKWVYDTLVKPHTEKYRKELFLCNGCDAGKLYALEGVIQHYAAKHTNSLSSGSIVVHWKAEWPEEPPFNPNPAAAVAVQYNPPPDYGRSGAYNPDPAGHYYNQGGYQHNLPPPEQYQQPYPAGYPSHTEYQDPYYTQQPEQYHAPPPDPYQQAHQGYPAPEQYGPPPPGAYSYPNGPSYPNGQLYPPSEHYPPGPYTGQYPPNNPYEAPAQYPPQGGAQPPAAQGYYDQTQQYSYGYPPAQYPPSNYYAPETQYAQQEDVQAYKAQLEHIAHNARDLWGKTAGVKDLPGSVRVQTIIHHLIQRSRASFPTDPPLTMLIDGLSNNKEMRPVRNVNELTCKTCSIAAEVDYQSSGTPSVKKFFSLPQLLNHFQSTHISAPQAISQQDAQADQPDWTTDMVELPDLASIARLTRAPGMDSSKLRLIEEALPEAFKPAPAPRQVQPQRRRHEQTDKRGSRRRDASYSRYQDRDRPFIKSEKPSSIDYEYSSRDSTEARFYDDRPYLPAEATDNRERAQSRQDYDRFYDEPHPVDVKMQEGRQKPRRSSTPHRETRAIYQRDESRVLPSKAQTRVEEYTGQRPLSRSKNLARHIEQMSKLAANPIPDTRAVSVRPEPAQVMSAPAAIADTAERLLSDFQPGGSDTIHESIQPMTASEMDSRIDDLRDRRRLDVTEDMRRIQSIPRDYSPQRLRQYEPDRMGTGSIRLESPAGPTSREHVTSSRPSYAYEYDDRYETPGPVPVVLRGRSPELVDHRYKVNNVVVHRDERERQGSHGPRRTPSRWARYESVRLEQERARSRSPVYVRVGPQASQYRDRSPQRQPELLYRPQHEQVEGIAYERIPRQEYYRVYAEVPHPRRVKYEERVEYVQIPDRPGEYYIRRPARPEPEPIYISYDERPYTEQPLVERSETREIRPMVTRADPAYYEEYDPRHPEPPPSAPTGTTPRSAQYKR